MLGTGEDIDMTLVGVGPVFSADQLVGDDMAVVNCSYTVLKAEDGGFHVGYRISCRIRMKTSKVKDSYNYEYRDVTLNGSVICQPAKPVTLLRNGEKSLKLTISKADEKASE